MKKSSSLYVMSRLIGFVKPLVPIMFLAIVMGIIGFLTAIFITVFGGYALLSILDIVAVMSIKTIYTCIVFFAVVRGLLHYAEQACNHYIAFKILALIRDKVFGALRKLAPAKLDGKDKGNLISVITSDIELLEVFYAHTISPIFIAIIVSIIMVVFISQYSIVLGIIALFAYITVGVIIPLIASKTVKKTGKTFRAEFGEMNAFFLDSMRGIKESIQYNYGKKRLQQINERTDSMSKTQEKMKKNAGANSAITGVAIYGFSVVMLFVSSLLYLNGQVGFDGVVISTIAMFSSFGSVIAVANLGSGLTQTIASGNRVMDILDDTPSVKEVTNGKNIFFDGVKFDSVDFLYADEKILDDFSIRIPERKIIGITGKSGSGKSTMLKLLMRFYDTNSGIISISNTDIKEINTKCLRDTESFVTQEIQLFHDSIESNIRIAKLDATRDEIMEACKKASVHDFIMTLPNDYDTEVGELGETLSGGERQRIGLARAFLHNAPLILLDEPTSNLDSLNEAVILKALKEDESRTVVIVSHRVSTMKIVDEVYSVEDVRRS